MTMTEQKTVQDLAGQAYDAFERRTRDNGEAFYSLTDDAPEWIQPIIRDAHGDMFPDDFVYEACMNAFGWIHDNDADEDSAHEFADSETDVYNSDLLRWVSSNLERVGYCDEAAAEFGIADDDGLIRRLSLGQYFELHQIFAAVHAGLVEVVETGTDDEGDEA